VSLRVNVSPASSNAANYQSTLRQNMDATEPKSPVKIEALEEDSQGAHEDGYLHSWRLAVVITSLFFGQLLMALDVNIINVAIPEISTHFQALNDVAWYGSAYLLTITAFQPSFGTMYRLFNIDVTYKVCIIIFEGMRDIIFPDSLDLTQN
jgi:hypothetical protein